MFNNRATDLQRSTCNDSKNYLTMFACATAHHSRPMQPSAAPAKSQLGALLPTSQRKPQKSLGRFVKSSTSTHHHPHEPLRNGRHRSASPPRPPAPPPAAAFADMTPRSGSRATLAPSRACSRSSPATNTLRVTTAYVPTPPPARPPAYVQRADQPSRNGTSASSRRRSTSAQRRRSLIPTRPPPPPSTA